MFVPDFVRKSVLFVGVKRNEVFHPRATMFIVNWVQETFTFFYLVTAEHVISRLITNGEEAWLRTNLKSGGPQEDPLSLQGWILHPDRARDGTDVAVHQVAFSADEDIEPIPLGDTEIEVAGTAKVLEKLQIGVGDEVAIVGLFRSHGGEQKNVPIVRIGNIAAMRDEPVWTRYCGYTDAYLVEAMSIGGLSGSPVIVNRPPMQIRDNQSVMTHGKQLYLLGLMHGHFDIQSINEDVASEDRAQSKTGIHTGIGVVIPVEKIIETLEHPDLVSKRRNEIDAHKKSSGAKPDVIDDAPAPKDATARQSEG